MAARSKSASRSQGLALGAYRPDYEEEDEMDQATFNRMANAWLESRADGTGQRLSGRTRCPGMGGAGKHPDG